MHHSLHHSLSAAVERELAERFGPAERRQAHVLLSQYGMSPHERDVEHVRRAMLALSGGDLGRLGYYLAAAAAQIPGRTLLGQAPGSGAATVTARKSLGVTSPSTKGRADVIPDLRDTILDTWRTSNRVTVFLVEHLPPEVWASAVPGAPVARSG